MHSHIIFSGKKRDPLLMPDFTPRLFEYIGGTLRNQKCFCSRRAGWRTTSICSLDYTNKKPYAMWSAI